MSQTIQEIVLDYVTVKNHLAELKKETARLRRREKEAAITIQRYLNETKQSTIRVDGNKTITLSYDAKKIRATPRQYREGLQSVLRRHGQENLEAEITKMKKDMEKIVKEQRLRMSP